MKFFFVASLLLVCVIKPSSGYGSGLNQCLSSINFQEHRLEKEKTIRYCFNKYKAEIRRKNCFQNIETLFKNKKSIALRDSLNAICFYETTSVLNMKDCLNESKKFNNSNNHDEAVFYCVQQFQDNLSQKDCQSAAEQLMYPLKKSYLMRYCETHENTNF